MKLKSMKDIEEEKKSNPKKKEEKDMKKFTQNSKVKTITTVFITLLAVASLVGAFLGGMSYQKSVNHEVSSKVKELTAVVSKTNQ